MLETKKRKSRHKFPKLLQNVFKLSLKVVKVAIRLYLTPKTFKQYTISCIWIVFWRKSLGAFPLNPHWGLYSAPPYPVAVGTSH